MFCVDCIMEDDLDRQNDDMNWDIKNQKKKLKKLLDKVELPFTKRAGHANLNYINVLLTIAGCMLQDILLRCSSIVSFCRHRNQFRTTI